MEERPSYLNFVLLQPLLVQLELVILLLPLCFLVFTPPIYWYLLSPGVQWSCIKQFYFHFCKLACIIKNFHTHSCFVVFAVDHILAWILFQTLETTHNLRELAPKQCKAADNTECTLDHHIRHHIPIYMWIS